MVPIEKAARIISNITAMPVSILSRITRQLRKSSFCAPNNIFGVILVETSKYASVNVDSDSDVVFGQSFKMFRLKHISPLRHHYRTADRSKDPNNRVFKYHFALPLNSPG